MQLPLLTNLHTLWYDNNERNDLAALSTLTSLSSLTLHKAKELPASLPNLTQLEQLEVYHPEALALSAVDEASLIEAVGQLQQLTCLAVGSTSLSTIPDALTGIQQLQRFLFWNGNGQPVNSGLPLGSWLGGLHWLGLTWSAARLSVSALTAAPRLEHLVITEHPNSSTAGNTATWAAFWDFVRTHPPLRCLTFALQSNSRQPMDCTFFNAVLDTARLRQALLIKRTDNAFCNLMTA